MTKTLTCIECPMGCEINVTLKEGKVKEIIGNGCIRGKAYAESEVVCPKRVLTSTVRTEEGKMIAVKTDRPIPKESIFEVMEKINKVVCPFPISLGDVVIKNVIEDINLVVSDNLL